MLENVFLEVPGGPFLEGLGGFVVIFGSRNRLGVIFDRSKERQTKSIEKRSCETMRVSGLPAPIILQHYHPGAGQI